MSAPVRFLCTSLLVALFAAALPAQAQELTVEQLIVLLQGAGIISQEKAQEARQAIGILGYERVETPSNTSCPQINRTLTIGSQGSDVLALQTYLKSMPHIYPSGVTSGYFGSLTQAAVKRYQAGLGIVVSGAPTTTGYGAVGPATRSALARCRTVPVSRPTTTTTTPQKPVKTIDGTHLTFHFEPYTSLNPIEYGGIIAVYYQYYNGYNAQLALARADILGLANRPFMPDVVAYVVRPTGEPQLVIFSPETKNYRVVLNDIVSAKEVYTLNKKGYAGYRDILVQTPDGKEITYTYSKKGEYVRLVY